MIRDARAEDISRIAEILVFGKRVAYRAIFRDDAGSFGGLQTLPVARAFETGERDLREVRVFDDGVVKGMRAGWIDAARGEAELCELYVEPFFTGQGIGGALLADFLAAARAAGCARAGLWVLAENAGARRLYEAHGFRATGETRFAEGTSVAETRYEARFADGEPAPAGAERGGPATACPPRAGCAILPSERAPAILPSAPADSAFIHERLRAYNRRFLRGLRDYSFHIADGGRIVAGIVAGSAFDTLEIEYLFVEEARRGGGLGAALLRHAEACARRDGLTRALVNTYSYQAPGFYRAMGYAPLCALTPCFGEYDQFFFGKSLREGAEGEETP